MRPDPGVALKAGTPVEEVNPLLTVKILWKWFLS
ncbi:hypothetical protein SLEP1_g18445 [Rubroshorea leprosula]|uniref:Uncharacterized protein n=1 Tax=Rubroshorea leprosula TaxID=152421 RepID=A0AAV5J6F0_9ROSI|nr:hypothetical protein SLEP1_g18445 [Rubroshorea leprosula]